MNGVARAESCLHASLVVGSTLWESLRHGWAEASGIAEVRFGAFALEHLQIARYSPELGLLFTSGNIIVVWEFCIAHCLPPNFSF